MPKCVVYIYTFVPYYSVLQDFGYEVVKIAIDGPAITECCSLSIQIYANERQVIMNARTQHENFLNVQGETIKTIFI